MTNLFLTKKEYEEENTRTQNILAYLIGDSKICSDSSDGSDTSDSNESSDSSESIDSSDKKQFLLFFSIFFSPKKI